MTGAALLAFLLLAPAPARADGYQDLADGVAAAARKAGVKRVAVMGFDAIGGSGSQGASAVAERLVIQLAGRDELQVVERTLLDRVLKEAKLAQTGAVDARGAQTLRVLGVDAIVSGSLIRKSARKVEVNVRLIHAADARILGAASAEVRPDWADDGRFEEAMDTPPLPSLDGDFVAWWEADALRKKVRTWAAGRESPKEN